MLGLGPWPAFLQSVAIGRGFCSQGDTTDNTPVVANGAFEQIAQPLTYAPKDANSPFSLGMIKLQAKHDRRGAIRARQKLLKLNPDLVAEKNSEVQRLIARAQQPKISN